MEFAYIFGRLVFSITSNVYQKKLSHTGLHPFYIVAATYCVLGLISAPLLAALEIDRFDQEFWLNVMLASLLDVGGWLFLVVSLSKTDFSVFGPLNAYKVVFSLLLAVVFLGEIPSIQGMTGIAVIIIGSFFLTPAAGTSVDRLLGLMKQKGVQARFLSIALFSIGTVFLKNAVIAGGPLATMVFWSLLGLPLVLFANLAYSTHAMKANLKASADHMHTILVIGLMVFLMQYFTLLLLSKMLVAYALALFQLGMVVQVFVGHTVFKEKHIARKLLVSLVMMCGSMLVLMAGS